VGNPGGDLTVALYSGSGGFPDAQLGTLTGSNPSGSTDADYTFTPTTTIILAPAMTYFAVLSGPQPSPGNQYNWRFSDETTESGEPGWFLSDIAVLRDNSIMGSWENETEPNPFKMAVNATAVPEPSGVGLLLLGAAPFILRRRRISRP